MAFAHIGKSKKALIQGAFGVLALLLLGAGVYLYVDHVRNQAPTVDAVLTKTFELIPAISGYSQYVETQTSFPDRSLKIVGSYEVDSAKESFASLSTTTLLIQQDSHHHDFTLENISIGADVYTRLQTSDPLLRGSIQTSPQWKHFTSSTIPQSFVGIAVSGPIQDNLQILGDGGAWLTLSKKYGNETWGKETLVRYRFTLSGKTPGTEGPLSAIIGRLGNSGHVDVWVDGATGAPRYLRFENLPYISTTTISNINTPPPIASPIGS